MALASPLEIGRVKDALRDVFIIALGASVPIVWGHQGIPRQPRPFVALDIIAGPIADGVLKEETRARNALTVSTVTVDSVNVGQTYRIRVNGKPAEYVAQAGDSVDDIRDALVAAVPLLDPTEAVTAAATASPGEFTVTPDTDGALLAVTLHTAELSKVDTTADVLVTDTVARKRLTISANFFAGTMPPVKLQDGALDMASKCATVLDLPESLILFEDRRVAARVIAGPDNLSGLEPGGAVIESHARMDLDCHAASIITRTIDPIETVEVTTNLSASSQTFTVS